MRTGPEGSEPMRARAARIVLGLERLYPEASCSLDHRNPLELLVATILSAQCTDERVNLVTPALFRRYRSAADYAGADRSELEVLIRSTGFFRNKAASLIGLGAAIAVNHGGEVPGRMEDLVRLPGVGRKTASVVLGSWFGIPAIPVDTHVARLAFRLGLTDRTDPEGIERDLARLLPEASWTSTCHALIRHGRKVCRARRPLCPSCALRGDCPYPGP